MTYNDPENVPPVWQVGDVILDRYEVKQVFTGGGMGLVYRVHHRGWAEEVRCGSIVHRTGLEDSLISVSSAPHRPGSI